MFLHTVKSFQVFLLNPNNSNHHYSFVCSVNGLSYFYVTQTIQFNISNFTKKVSQTVLFDP